MLAGLHLRTQQMLGVQSNIPIQHMLTNKVRTSSQGLQSICITHAPAYFLNWNFQICLLVLNNACEIQISPRNFISLSIKNSSKISFLSKVWDLWEISGFLCQWWVYFALNSWLSKRFSEKSSKFRSNVGSYKEEFACSFQIRKIMQVTHDIVWLKEQN